MIARVKEWGERLEEMKLTASKKAPPKADSKLPPPLRKALKELAEESYVVVVLGELAEAAEAMTSGDGPLDEDDEDEGVSPYILDWDTGVEHFQSYTPEQLWTHLGLADGVLPGFNTLQDPNGIVDPWQVNEWKALVEKGKVTPLEPFWHQIVGIAELADRAIAGKPTLLMDEVGVGKTLQVVGLNSVYAQYHDYYKLNKCFPGNYSKYLTRFNASLLTDLICRQQEIRQGRELARQAAHHHRPACAPYAVDEGAASVPGLRGLGRTALHSRVQPGDAAGVLGCHG